MLIMLTIGWLMDTAGYSLNSELLVISEWPMKVLLIKDRPIISKELGGDLWSEGKGITNYMMVQKE